VPLLDIEWAQLLKQLVADGWEADFSWANLKVKPIFDCFINCSTEMQWLSTVRGRLGTTFANPSLIVFVTGGVAFADIEHIVEPVSKISSVETGWTVGAGIEWAVGPQWSAKVEYLHVDFGKQLSCPIGPCDLNNNANYVRADIVRFGLNYRFATGKAPTPVVTKY